ncbi:MAG: FAD-dependent oxidoreductase [Candidatus Marinimicrobia bacterium]|nr:FAD-dependent oxidoreductase [Candidatus Neomarinimicrobiota bacterium]MCF7827568.1 FAD-dependent oxidoreductase [Candidatus Neomarinimicrobiota bacterium]MCF7881570.1 FAD-dependent oxidoreductase [Candidatus Neomarinimicrobiota bacterium]
MDNAASDVIVIGGGPAGVITALTALRYYPDKSVTLIKNQEVGIIPCGIPYMFNSLDSPDDNKMGIGALESNGVTVLTDEVTQINRNNKNIKTTAGKALSYEKLVLATGSKPVVPPIPGAESDRVFPIKKDIGFMKSLVEKIKEADSVLIVGGGFIGVELADEIAGLGDVDVHLVEMLPDLLANSFDAEFGAMAEERLLQKQVNVIKNTRVEEFASNGKLTAAKLSNGETISIDYAIIGIGSSPNTSLAENAGLNLFDGSGIWVDEYMRTTDPDIFAVGDCAAKRDFFTRAKTSVMLASTATAEARIAGANLYRLKVVRENKGTIAIYSTYVDGLVLGSAGLTERTATRENFEVITGRAEGPDKHPGKLPGTNQCKVKLIFSKNSETIMGGQVAGGPAAGEMINIIGAALQKRASRTEFETMQMATHPYLTAAPTQYPIVVAAQNASYE